MKFTPILVVFALVLAGLAVGALRVAIPAWLLAQYAVGALGLVSAIVTAQLMWAEIREMVKGTRPRS